MTFAGGCGQRLAEPSPGTLLIDGVGHRITEAATAVELAA
jgi:hypothetical protein